LKTKATSVAFVFFDVCVRTGLHLPSMNYLALFLVPAAGAGFSNSFFMTEHYKEMLNA
jgi:hypothetical protein